MPATAPLSPLHKGKQRLLASCAIAAGLVALAHGGPALAQVAGSGSFVTGGGAGSSIVDNAGTNTTTVTVGTSQSVINWVPTDNAPTGGAIDILPAGENWNFIGTGDYTVLNRFVDGSGGALSRQIALNGTVNSFIGATTGPRGGNIWFYNAGGILIGASGVINVGSLMLTTNDIDTTGGLFGPGGAIRLAGASGSPSAITVNGAINANIVGSPGSSYVALVAPRVVQAGNVRVDGSAAYVAAEAANIRINGGLFDIDVTIGAEGGTAISHTGTTTGPAHLDTNGNQSRVYMVAIPKNDAVTMLVGGAIGYDDAISAQVDPDGAVRLSAGYNIVGGELAATPVNATAANITATDTLLRSDTIARASGTFAAGPTQTLPGSPSPLSFDGQFFVEGNGSFTGDVGASLTIGAGQQAGATGSFTIQSGGTAAAAGNAAINVTGGTLSAGSLTVQASATPDAVTGDAQGGTASLTISGGSVSASGVTVEANGVSDEGSSGATGTGRGGNASITVSNTGSSLTAGNVFINARGSGDATFISGPPTINGDGIGGNASLTITDGGSVGPVTLLSLDASGRGGIGTTQSGDGIGGAARISVTGADTFLSATQTFVQAGGDGGGSLGPFQSQNGGAGTGGTAAIGIDTDAASTISLGAVLASALARGGNASGGENTVGGNATGGDATLTVDGGVTAQATSIALNGSALAGSALSTSGTTGQTGDTAAGDVVLAATNGSTLASSSVINLFAVGMGVSGENFGTGAGGTVAVNATGGGTISAANTLFIQAMGGNMLGAIGTSAGDGVGGDVDLNADGGTIQAEIFDVDVSGSTVNVTGAGGIAQGGTIDLFARGGGQIVATLDATTILNAGAQSGVSAAGTAATGGTVQLIANAGTIDLSGGGTLILADGVSGGAAIPGATNPTGAGGTILLRAEAEASDTSQIMVGDLLGSANGLTQPDTESFPGLPGDTAGNGLGGTASIAVEGGSFTGGVIDLSANGFGGGTGAGSATGTGGTASFIQTAGAASIGDMRIAADGFGGFAESTSGIGIGGIATIDLSGGTMTVADITASAEGIGGDGLSGNDDDPGNIIPGGDGGQGRGGSATINISGTAIVDASVIQASAVGNGGRGGEFFNFSSFSGVPGTPGDGAEGVGGIATINVTGGTTTASSIIADASGIGGDGGESFFSSSSGGATGVGVGGTGGNGRGGTATIALEAAIPGIAAASSIAAGLGGAGGDHNVGGTGGDGFGGIAQTIVSGFEAGELAVTIDSTGNGGNGGNANDGDGGDGGTGTGGTSRMQADGAGASLTAIETNFVTGGVGGNGGTGNLSFGSFPTVAPNGGNGGDGVGGAIEIAANDGAAVTLGLGGGSVVTLGGGGRGGAGGTGANSVFGGGNQAGNGGDGGNGTGGTVRLVAAGGTISSGGEAVDITTNGVVGEGGSGGIGQGGGIDGTLGANGTNAGGRVEIISGAGSTGPGQITLGPTTIQASGDTAGRIELRTSGGNIDFAGLSAQAFGLVAPTDNDTDSAATGIFVAPAGGTIATQGDVTLTTDGSIGVYGQSNGIFDVDGTLTIDAGDQIDIRHDNRTGTAPTLSASGDLTMTAVTSISAAAGSLAAAGGTLSLTVSGPTGTIAVDGLAGGDILMTSLGAAMVEHAEAVGDFIASAGSFATGLNSIITGGNIDIVSPGAVDLGNSSAGGFVQVSGQSIAFNNIDAGLTVNLSAAEGIDGGAIAGGGDITLFANSVALAGPVTGDASFFAFGIDGAVSVDAADVAGTISIFAADDLTGSFIAGGDIFLNSDANIAASAVANGGYVDLNGIGTEGNLFVIAAGNANLTTSGAARMFGVSAGGAASINGGTVGEDMLVLAGTTASLANITAGDDVTVQAPGDITANGVATTGAGADLHILGFTTASGSPMFTITAQAANGADIVMQSAAGAIDAAALSAGDDILLNAANDIAVNGATTLGLGVTGGDSSLRTQGGATTLADVASFSDVVVNAAGLANLAGPVNAGRDIAITAADVTIAALTDPGGNALATIGADGNVVIDSSAGISGGGIRALADTTLTATTAIDVTSVESQNVTLTGATGIAADQLIALGATSLDSDGGNIEIASLVASGPIDASADAIRIEGGGDMAFQTLTTDVGDAFVRASGDLSLASGSVAGTADLGTQGAAMTITALTATNAILAGNGGVLNLDTVTVAGDLNASALSSLGITGIVTGQAISLASADIAIDPAGRVGTAGVTQTLSVANNNSDNQTFIGGAPGGSVAGYHIDADELTRLYGTQIEVFAPEVASAGGTSVGSAAPPDVIVDSFTVAGGAAGSNLGANGALTIRTPGKMRVIGNVELTGLTDANALNLIANDALEVILGQGSVRLVNGTDAAGQLNLVSDDVIVATAEAIADVGAATTTDAINTRLADNDGVVLDEGALLARGIRAEVVGGFYVQNSGAGTELDQRRGLTFGAGGLDVVTEGPSRIVINGVHLGPSGQVTGLEALQLVTVNGVAPASGTYDPQSTVNGCLISSPTVCTTIRFEDGGFPVQDVIEEEIKVDEDSPDQSNNLSQALITMRDVDPLSGEPLVDDPVTGAGNDDLWTPPAE